MIIHMGKLKSVAEPFIAFDQRLDWTILNWTVFLAITHSGGINLQSYAALLIVLKFRTENKKRLFFNTSKVLYEMDILNAQYLHIAKQNLHQLGKTRDLPGVHARIPRAASVKDPTIQGHEPKWRFMGNPIFMRPGSRATKSKLKTLSVSGANMDTMT